MVIELSDEECLSKPNKEHSHKTKNYGVVIISNELN